MTNKRWASGLLLVLGWSAATLGCGGGDGGTTVDGGVTVDGQMVTPDAAAADSGPGGACNTITNTDALTQWTVIAQVAPTAMGAIIANGTYKLTAQNFYGSPGVQTLPPMAWTVVVNGTTWQQLARTAQVSGASTTTAAVSGTNVSLTPSCPTAAGTTPFSYGFTASASEIKLYRPGGTVGAAMEQVLTKQP